MNLWGIGSSVKMAARWVPVTLLPLAVVLLTLQAPDTSAAAPPTPPKGQGAAAAQALLERILPGAKQQFELTVEHGLCGDVGCFTLADAAGGKVAVRGSSTSELTAGIGAYLMNHANLTFGWCVFHLSIYASSVSSEAALPVTLPRIAILPPAASASVAQPTLPHNPSCPPT